jgi:transmembrane sensor
VDELIIRFLGGQTSSFEAERLKRWREEAPENEAYFQEMALVWELTTPEPAEVDTPPPPKAGELLSRSSPLPFKKPPRRWRNLGPWGLLAASLAALAIGPRFLGDSSPTPSATHIGPEEGSLTVTLADGSYARLAPGSILEEYDEPGQRRVSLRGRAFFAVARDESRPFTVSAGSGAVRVLGTRFQVEDAPGGEVRTVVVEGLVALSNEFGSVEVEGGELARAEPGQQPVASRPEDLRGYLDWPDGILVFQGTPLHQVVQEVSRHFGKPLRVSGEDARNRRVTAWFGPEGFQEVVESLCLVTGSFCEESPDGVLITSPGGEEGGAP